MKNLYKIFILIAVTIGFVACEDTDKDPVPPLVEGAWAHFGDISSPFIDPTDLANSFYQAEVIDPNNNLTRYTIFLNATIAGAETDTVQLKTYTSFPANVTISAVEAAAALGVDINSFAGGDKLNVFAELQNSTGYVLDLTEDRNGQIGVELFGNPGQRQAVEYPIFFACTIDNDFTGDYSVVQTQGAADPFFGNPTRFYDIETEVVAENPILRSATVNYASFSVTFTFQLTCGEVLVPYQTSGVGCGGPGLNFVGESAIALYDEFDDSSFTVEFTENIDGGCGLPATQNTILEFTRL